MVIVSISQVPIKVHPHDSSIRMDHYSPTLASISRARAYLCFFFFKVTYLCCLSYLLIYAFILFYLFSIKFIIDSILSRPQKVFNFQIKLYRIYLFCQQPFMGIIFNLIKDYQRVETKMNLQNIPINSVFFKKKIKNCKLSLVVDQIHCILNDQNLEAQSIDDAGFAVVDLGLTNLIVWLGLRSDVESFHFLLGAFLHLNHWCVPN